MKILLKQTLLYLFQLSKEGNEEAINKLKELETKITEEREKYFILKEE